MNRSKIALEHCQIKSAEKFKAVAQAIDTLEKETFIKSGWISLVNCFVCPDIDLIAFYKSGDPTERLLAIICISLHCKQYGKNSRKAYLEIQKEDRQRRRVAKERAKPRKA